MEKAVGNGGISAPLVFLLFVVYYAISILLRRRLDCVWFKVVIHIHLYASKRVVGRKWVAEVITVLYELKHCF